MWNMNNQHFVHTESITGDTCGCPLKAVYLICNIQMIFDIG